MSKPNFVPTQNTRITCVIIEDDPEQRDLFRGLARLSGIQVVGMADDGKTAIAVLLQTKPDFALVDGGNLRNTAFLPAARDRALRALAKPGCANLFGSKLSGFARMGKDPASVLKHVLEGSRYAHLEFAPIPDHPTWAAGTFMGLNGTSRIVIDPTMGWNLGNANYNALTLLHELAHLYNDLPILGGFQIPNAAENSDAFEFDQVLNKECFDGKLNFLPPEAK